MNPEIFAEIEKMTEQEKQQLLNTQFPEELEKQANSEIDTELFADALYNYGWLQAQRSVAEEQGLDKVAAEDLQAHEKLEADCGEQIEACLNSLQTHMSEDTVELHKEAQVAAAIIFEGYSDCLEDLMEKDAAAAGKAQFGKGIIGMAKKNFGKMKEHAGAALAKGKEIHGKAIHLLKKHPGKAAGGAALGGAAIGAGVYHKMKKESSALTEEQMIDLISDIAMEKQAMVSVVAEGIDKLAKKGEMKGKKMHEMCSKASKASSKSSKSSSSSSSK